MAKTVLISTKDNAAKVVVDGNEVSDVISYELAETSQGTTLKLEIAVMGEIEARL